ncbi:proton-coupled thiamine transporter YuaJ [Clostridia bacterium]|nr:proton-coupled thiamine transporter YuaJ [Clostridia bacterium]
MTWLNELFENFTEMSPATIAALAALILVGVGILVSARESKAWTAKTVAVGALCVAVSFLLSCIRLFRMPQGGSVTPASMLPLMAFAMAYGVGPGIIVGVAAGFLQLLQDFWVLSFTQMLLDYPIAFGALALAGLFRGKLGEAGIFVGVVVGSLARFVCSALSGVVFFGSYAPEGMNVWAYSLSYNGTVIGMEIIICLVILAIPAVRTTVRRINTL